MRILLTGNKGFIGTALERELLDRGDTVIGLDLVDNQNLLTCELPTDVDLVIHLAGRSGVRESINDPASYWMNNVEATRRLLEHYHDKRVLYASSSSAYEYDLNPYANSKYVIEEIARRHPDCMGMRFHTVYSDTPRKNMFLDKLLNGTLEYTTNHSRDFIHIDDLVRAIIILIENPQENGVIDIGTGIMVNVRQLAPHLPVKEDTPRERQETCADTRWMRSLGWEPQIYFHEFFTKRCTAPI
jgi:UDP-glucose 4-epimerase